MFLLQGVSLVCDRSGVHSRNVLTAESIPSTHKLHGMCLKVKPAHSHADSSMSYSEAFIRIKYLILKSVLIVNCDICECALPFINFRLGHNTEEEMTES